MPTKYIGELNIAMDLALCQEDLSATFVGKDLPQAIRMKEKYTPYLDEYGRQTHGFPFVLSSKWNGHVDSVGFLVGVDTAARVNCFDEAEFKNWLSKKYKQAVKEVLSGNTVSLSESYSEGNVSTNESGSSKLAEQSGMVGPEGDSQQEMSPHHQSPADSVKVNQGEDIGGKHQRNIPPSEGVVSEGSRQDSLSLDLTDKESVLSNSAEQSGMVGPERQSPQEISPHHQLPADSVKVGQDEDTHGKHPGHIQPGEGVASEGSHQESISLDLTEKQINQLNRFIKGNQTPERNERIDIVERITLGILNKNDKGSILVEGNDLAERIKLDEPFDGLEFTRTDEIAIRVKTIWPSPDAMIALALTSEAAGTSSADLKNVLDEEN
jgi:hypothetical protein